MLKGVGLEGVGVEVAKWSSVAGEGGGCYGYFIKSQNCLHCNAETSLPHHTIIVGDCVPFETQILHYF